MDEDVESASVRNDEFEALSCVEPLNFPSQALDHAGLGDGRSLIDLRSLTDTGHFFTVDLELPRAMV